MHKKTSLIVGNWKMNGDRESLNELKKLKKNFKSNNCDIIICPPTTLISSAHDILVDTKIEVGAQNCHHMPKGAFTGEISALMLKDIGVSTVIVGHSERRQQSFETDDIINKKILKRIGI